MKFRKLNQKGVAHYLVGVLVVAFIGAAGTYVMTNSHAATPSNVSSSSQPATLPQQMLFENSSNYDLYTSTNNGPASLVTTGVYAAPSSFPATYAQNGSVIYYITGNQLDSISPNGQNKTVVANLPVTTGFTYTSLAWSEKAQKLAIIAWGQNNSGNMLFTINGSGSDLTNVLNASFISSPVWSPTGNNFAFIAETNNDSPQYVYTMSANGGNQQQITAGDCSNSGTQYADGISWSPDGNTLYCASPGVGINSVETNNTNPQTILSPSSLSGKQTINVGTVSPDGTKILYSTYAGSGTSTVAKVFVLTLATNKTKLIAALSKVYVPVIDWSPDSSAIAFGTVPESGAKKPTLKMSQVYTAEANGTHLQSIYTVGTSYGFASGINWSVQ